MASVITNFQTVEDVIKTSSDASGSAMAENEKYLDSIQGKMDQFTNSLQTFWMDTINSKMVKGIIDLGRGVIELVDKIGLLPTALAGVLLYFTAFKKNNPVTIFRDLSTSMQNYGVALKQIKAIQSLNGINGTTKLSTDEFNAQNISAYAAAVSNLTAKKQAAALASAGLTQAQIQEAMAANGVDQANIKQAMSEANVATAKTATVNTTVAEALALTEEQTAKLSATASNWLLENSSKQLTLSLVQEAIEHGVITPEIGAEIIAKYNLAAANTTVATTIKGITASIKAMMASNPVGWILLAVGAITSLVSWLGNLQQSNEEIIQQADEIKNAYKQEADTIQNNISTIQSLEEEFNQLSSGVDDYGRNISLATDDYERYKEIVETLVGISPSLVEGYDSEGNAIANKNGLLQESIKLMQKEQRIKAQDLVSSENIQKIKQGVEASINELENEYKPNNDEASQKFRVKFQEIMDKMLTDKGISESVVYSMLNPEGKDIRFNTETQLFEGEDVTYYGKEYSGLAGNFADKFYDQIVEDLRKDPSYSWIQQFFTEEEKKQLLEFAAQHEKNLAVFEDKVKTKNKELNSALQAAPLSELSYYELTDEMKGYLTQYIDNLDVTTDNFEKKLQEVIDLTNFIAKNEDVQSIMSIGFKLNIGQDENGKSLTISDYQKQVADFKKKIQESTYTDDQKNMLLSMFGLDNDDSLDNEIDDAVAHVKNLLKGEVNDIQNYIDNLSVSDALYIKYKITADPNSLTVDELKERIKQLKAASGEDVISVKTYSSIIESIESVNEALSQTKEVILDDTEVTQEYKDSLTALGISEEELSSCFYENNKLVVKNASRLKQLVSVAKANISTQTTLARAQARLKYKELYKQLASLTNGQLKNAQANKVQINTLYQEMSAIQKTIAKYSLLEQQLSEVTKTYTEFEEAQTIDSDNDYMSKTEEMLVAAIQAYQTGELGTETAQISIKALVPEIVLENEDTVEEKAKAAHDYLMETLNKYFVLDFDEDTGEIQGAEMKMGNLRKFIEDGLGNNVFAGTDWQHFEWSDTFLSGLEEAPDKLQYFADKMNITKEVALGVIQEINNHDIEWLNGDYGSLFDQIVPETLDSKLQTTTARMAELNVQLANGKITQEEYEAAFGGLEAQLANGTITADQYKSRLEELNKQYADGKITQEEFIRQVNGLNGQLVAQQEAAVDTCNSFIDLNDKMDESQKKLESYQKQLQSGADENGNKLTDEQISEINDQYTKELQNYEGYLKQKSDLEKKYGPMTEYTVSVALEQKGIDVDNINDELDEVKKEIDDKIKTLNSYFNGIEVSINDDGKIEYKVIDGTEDSQLNTLKELGAINKDGTVNIDLAYKGLTPEQQVEVNNLKNLEDKQNLINYYLSMNGVDTVQTAIDKLTTTLNNIYELLATSPVFSANVEPETKTALDGLLDKVRSWVGDHVANFISYVKERNAEERSSVPPETGMIKVNGTAHATGNFGLSSSEHNALVGELGTELVVNPYTGRYYTVGDNGAEMVDLPKGAIIFNHKQTEDLLKNGYVTSRGKMLSNGTAYAEGNAHVTLYPQETVNSQWEKTGYSSWDDSTYDAADALQNAADSLSDSADSVSDAADEFEEVFDWIEVRLEEINEQLDLMDAQLENATNYASKNNIIDNIIGVNETKIANLTAGIQKYSEYAAKLLNEVPAQYRTAAQDGMIAITEFAGEADEATVKAIENYREWAQKVADLRQELESTKTTIRDLAIQKIDNAYNSGDVRATIEASQTEKLQNAVDLDEESGYVTSAAYYTAMMENSNKTIEYLTKARNEMQKAFNEAVKSGKLERGSDEWYENLDKLYQVDAEIDEATIELEKFQNAINEIYWDNFENLTNQIEYLKDQTQSLIDLMENSGDLINKPDDKEYWGANDVEWTKEGITSLGLYAQQMEIAEFEARQYAEAIDDLQKDYKAGKYSESEYLEKLNELTSAQYDAIDSYYEAQDAIVDLNKTRIDAIKDGIEKEIDAYEELISKKKEELSAEKDLYDFQKSTMEQQKNISDIQRKLAALSSDNSSSAVAQRKKLEAELAEAKSDLEESYYDRSIENNQNALDKELENFQDEKNSEIEKWDQYLENVEQVVADSLNVVQANAISVYDTLNAKAQEYDLTLSDSILTPWKDGALAVSDYQTVFDTSMSSTMDQLEAMKNKWQEIIDKMVQAGKTNVNNINKENANYAAAKKPTSGSNSNTNKAPTSQAKAISVGGKINAGSAKIYSSVGGTAYNQYFSSDPIYTVLEDLGEYLKVRWHKASSGVTGFFKKSDVKALAVGTKKLKESGLVNVDELGEELVLRAQNGRLTYLEKGSGVVPANLTENLMQWGELDPSSMIEQNRPSIKLSPDIHNTEISIDNSIAELIHIDNCSTETIPDVQKIVNEALEKHTQRLNQSLRKYVR